jgi:hypothetical protein
VVWKNKKDGSIADDMIGGGAGFRNTLSTATTPLVGERGDPDVFVWALDEG